MQNLNVLYIFCDQLSMMALNIYGNKNKVNTPNIDYLAKNGVKFTRSYCTTPQCSPSRSSLLTGLYPHKTEVLGNIGTNGTEELNPRINTIGKHLKDKGYQTGYFGKWHLGNVPVTEFGFDKYYLLSDGKEQKSKRQVKSSELEGFLDFCMKNQDKDDKIAQNAVDFINSQKENSWFAMVSFDNPHDIYLVHMMRENGLNLNIDSVDLPDNFYDDLKNKMNVQKVYKEEDCGRTFELMKTEKDFKYYIAFYYYLIEKVDKNIGTIIESLRQSNQLDNTVIMFSSDHGDLMLSHGCPFKGPMMYDELIKIPFIISCPGIIPMNESRDQLASNIDVFPTICDLLGYEKPEGLDGYSLKNCIFDTYAKVRDYIFVEYFSKQKWINPIRTVIDTRFKYNVHKNGEEELFDLFEEPLEINNLVEEALYQEKRNEMRQILFEWIVNNNDLFCSLIPTNRSGDTFKT